MATKVTPLMKQYNAIKAKHPDALLLFRVGDFYETFGEDAVRAAKILNITLTARNNGGDKTELAGFPHHALNTYLPKLVTAGCRVAICDQLEDPKQTKTIVKRGVTELVTPGVAINDDILQAKKNNFLAAIYPSKKELGVAFLDISTGEFLVAEGSLIYIQKLLQNFGPAEVLFSKQKRTWFKDHFSAALNVFYLEDWVFQPEYAKEKLTQHFNTLNLKGFGVEQMEQAQIAAGAIMHYLQETQHSRLEHITNISRIAADKYLWMDQFTIRNLELYHRSSPEAVTLLDILDHTQSPMGGRMMQRWLALPLKDLNAINSRHDQVAHWVSNPEALDRLRAQLGYIRDLERLASKVATAKVNPREVVQLKNSLEALVPLIQAVQDGSGDIFNDLLEKLDPCDALREQIKATLDEEAPILLSKGKVIATGFNAELDELREIAGGGIAYLDQMVAREAEQTGISSLKIASNNVFGYYIEVRNTHKDKVPEHWIRKQTLVNSERYITEELKEYEQKIQGAEAQIAILESNLYQELLQAIMPYLAKLQANAQAVAAIDCLCSFAHLAISAKYTRPQMNDGFEINIKDGRHPVIEKQLPPDTPYVANDVFLDREQQQLIMITGPNMSGKSAILRQTALISLMAQMGCFVPAASADLGVVDKIFTRVGASDNISMGESTFMVEMNETASILNNISERSLVLLDEIGRGTSTYDGISIAWAISEYLHEHPARPKTLFATHYHELNEMTDRFERIKNYNVSVKETSDNVLFLRKLVPGGSHHSFGIHVAKMAGMPDTVIKRSNKILKRLETSHSSEQLNDKMSQVAEEELQLSFIRLDDPLLEEIRDEILELDIDTLTPVEALMKLNEIKRLLSRNRAERLKK
ncbi:DNA mismatch repair protein MutS [Gilvibacter sp. SZ-19]|uniref:DNA mismatch repair protein MutS n=1 Tax=Gilvibacter sp. SZ-19 TaxID=754429 RepID=UPI000B584496|nr:DNA mismatch repair protein MutS [Gilvibacter sp. SZ-19]ARV11483.1 DNA mismatch repair protein MutS [Gilvibacter sp. SZ-19]